MKSRRRMLIDPGYIAIVVGLAILATGFYAGKNFWTDRAVQITMDLLIDNGYLKYVKDADGEIELIRLDTKKPNKLKIHENPK